MLLAGLLWQLLIRIRTTLLVYLICAVIFIRPVSANGLGGYGGAFLREPVGAAAFSIGGAQTASADYLCSWWNPATLSRLKQKKLTLGVGYRPLGRSEGYLSFEFPVPPRVGMGLSVLYRGILAIDDLVDDQEYPLETSAYSTYSFKIGLSYLIRRNLHAGVNISILHQSLPYDYADKGSDNTVDVKYATATEIGGIDIGVSFLPTKKLAYGLVLKNLLASYNWEFYDGATGLNIVTNDILPATVTLGQEFKTMLLGKPFIWTCDCVGYIFNGKLRALDHKQLVINNGFEWQRWKLFYIRSGLRDITLNRDLFVNRDTYKDHFTLAFSLGFLLDLSHALKGKDLKLNYGISNDKVGAGFDQQLDFLFSF